MSLESKPAKSSPSAPSAKKKRPQPKPAWALFFYQHKKAIVASCSLILAILILCLSYVIYVPMASGKQPRTVAIPYGASTRTIAAILYRHQLIRNQEIFRLYARAHRIDRRLRAGFFVLSPSQSLSKIALLLGQENNVGVLVRVTIPEGLSLTQIGRILESKELTTQTAFVKFTQRAKPIFQERYPFLEMVPTQNLEGYLFPDTYFFAKGVDVSVIVNACLNQFNKKIVQEWASATGDVRQNYSFHEVVTMASIIESEARRPLEMPLIAAVFYNRLHKNMAMASDPTVLYALGKTLASPVSYNDLKIDSPYNTYLNKGYPPTPIGAPGLASFRAALHPASAPYLFFVADQEGGHLFTKTYQDHLRVQRDLARKQK